MTNQQILQDMVQAVDLDRVIAKIREHSRMIRTETAQAINRNVALLRQVILTKEDFQSFKRYDYVSRTSLGEMTGEILVNETLKLVTESPAATDF
jgi:hypothetical protein